jgi:Cu/Ag efflux pump CusA
MKLLNSLTFPYNYIAGGVGILLIVLGIVLGTVQCKKIDANNTEKTVQTGVIKEREAHQEEVINHVQEAHEAITNPTPAERNIVCSKYDRNCPNGK